MFLEIPVENMLHSLKSATEAKFSYSLLLVRSIVSNVIKIMANFISAKS